MMPKSFFSQPLSVFAVRSVVDRVLCLTPMSSANLGLFS
jgi:hypothetical protein